MTLPDPLARKIRSTGFACTGCGSCCQRTEEDSGLVMVSCAEIRTIMAATGLSWEDVAVPYPELACDGKGGLFALGWCLRQEGDFCRFLSGKRCTIYANRPWICRTYPFMLDGERLVVSACEGLGRPLEEEAAHTIADDLRSRQTAEESEALLIRKVIATNPVPAGAIVDSEGVKVIHG